MKPKTRVASQSRDTKFAVCLNGFSGNGMGIQQVMNGFKYTFRIKILESVISKFDTKRTIYISKTKIDAGNTFYSVVRPIS